MKAEHAPYVHGYSERESERLQDQANTLSELLHQDSIYPAGSVVLEAGCGTGAQTIHLASRNPSARFVSMDVSTASLDLARARIERVGLHNVEFLRGDIFALPFADGYFDHVFSCFVLEHLSEPERALRALKRVLRYGGAITAIEGDHGSWYAYPQTAESTRAVQCLIEAQARLGGDSLIGRRVYPLLMEAGFANVSVSPRMVYVDSSTPDLVENFSKRTFIAMVEGVREQALAMGLIDEATWEKGIAGLYRATEKDGTFCYTFFKGTGTKS
jgi:ubiquinone/menaquinone biosynthesis C-methylase UbiE